MSGHSKWSTIKRKKGANDAKRGKLFTKLIKEITVAASEGGGDPDTNPRLRAAVQNAKGMNMPKDTIQRAINKADRDSSSFMELTFEGMLPHGVGVFIDCLTDNRNRTSPDIKHAFDKNGGNLGASGSVSFLFDFRSIFALENGGTISGVVTEAGAGPAQITRKLHADLFTGGGLAPPAKRVSRLPHPHQRQNAPANHPSRNASDSPARRPPATPASRPVQWMRFASKRRRERRRKRSTHRNRET